MDMSSIGAITSSINAARDIAKAALGVRDFKLVSDAVLEITDQLLKAQEALLRHQAMLIELTSEKLKDQEEIRALQKALDEQKRYTLVEVTPSQFAYRVNITPADSGTPQPASAEALHYICQGCFDKGRKVVLQGGSNRWVGPIWHCPACKTSIRRAV